MRDIVKMVVVLFVACGLAAGSLAVVNAVTKERIANGEERRKADALRKVAGQADDFTEIVPGKVWQIVNKGQPAGNVFIAEVQGYSGPISMAFGTDAAGAIAGLEVMSQTETPGLGAKIMTEKFRSQFKGKTLEQLALKKDDAAKGQIDAISGATISSRAVANAVRSTLESFDKEKTGESK